jgi:hypothetical protein
MHPPSPTGLYWSVHGEVACADHAPEVEDPRWNLEGWAPAPTKVRSGTVQGTQYEYQCQHCALDGRAVVHVLINLKPH